MKYRIKISWIDYYSEEMWQVGPLKNFWLSAFMWGVWHCMTTIHYGKYSIIRCEPAGTKIKVISDSFGEIEVTADGGGGYYHICTMRKEIFQ